MEITINRRKSLTCIPPDVRKITINRVYLKPSDTFYHLKNLEILILKECRIYGQYGPCKDPWHGFSNHVCCDRDKIIEDGLILFSNQSSDNKHFANTIEHDNK